MRILYVADFLPHQRSDQGGAKLLDWYMRNMRSRGHEVGLLCLCQPKDRPYVQVATEEWSLCDVTAVENTYLRRARSFLGSLVQTEAGSYCASSGFNGRAKTFIETHQFDVVHAVHSWMVRIADAALRVSARRGTRLVGEVFNINCILLQRKMRATRSIRTMKDLVWSSVSEYRDFGLADAIITHTSEDTAALQTCLRPRIPVREVPTWFDAIDRIRVEPLPAAATQDFLVIGTSADPLMRGWVEWLIAHVWPTVHSRFPDARLKLISVRPEHRDLWATTPGVEPIAYVDDLVSHLDSAAALVFPLVGGGSGAKLKVLNAAARGLPVVMTSAANTTGPLQDGVQAAICDDAEAFIGAMSRILSEPEYGRSLASGALRWLRSIYVDVGIADQLEALYCEVAQE